MKKLIVLLMCAGLVSAASAGTFSFSEDWESITAPGGLGDYPAGWSEPNNPFNEGAFKVVTDPSTGSNALSPAQSALSGPINTYYTGTNLDWALDYTVEADLTWDESDWPWTGFAMNVQGNGQALLFRVRNARIVYFNMTDLNTTAVSSTITSVDAGAAGWDAGETWHVTCSVTHQELGVELEASGYNIDDGSETFTIAPFFVDYDKSYSGWGVGQLANGGGFAITSRHSKAHYIDNLVVNGTLLVNPVDDAIDPLGTYVDVDETNTEAADGTTSPWYNTEGGTDGLWRLRENFREYFYSETGDPDDPNSTIFEQDNQTTVIDEVEVTDSLLAVTTIDSLTEGTEYEIRAVFWVHALQEYNALAGLSETDLTLYSPQYSFTDKYGQYKYVRSTLPVTGVSGSPDFKNIYEVQPLLGTAVADTNGEIKAYFSGANLQDDGDDMVDQRTFFDGFRYQEAKLDVVESDGSTLVTDTTSDSFTVALASAPSDTVTVDIRERTIADEVDLSTSSLVFTTGNWSTPQTVIVSGKPNVDADYANTTLILEASSAGDAYYDGFTTTVYVEDADCGIYDYALYDFDTNCVVNLADFAIFAARWLDCTDPTDSACVDARPWK